VISVLGIPMAERRNTSLCKLSYKHKSKAEEVNVASFIAQAARLQVQQDYLDKAQAVAVKSLKCLDHYAVQDLSAIHKEMECQR
jgi:hypothetical protein